MLTRKQKESNPKSNGGLPPEVEQARLHLKRTGWSYRKAAPELNVNFTHLALVLRGHRTSRRLLSAVKALPPRF